MSELGKLVEQQVIDRIGNHPRADVLQLLRALLTSRISSQAVCILAGSLAQNFQKLHPKEIRQLQQLAVVFHKPRLTFPPDEEKLYSWCLSLAVRKPEVAQGSIGEASGDAEEGPLSVYTHEVAKGENKGTAEPLEQDTFNDEDLSDDGDSILILEPGDFSYECRLASVDSLPNFPDTPEDSDDEYCKALVAQQANEAVLQQYAFPM